MILRKIDKRILTVWLVGVLTLTLTITISTEWNPIGIFLLSINTMTFLAMMIDKIQATQRGRRLSERALYFMTVLGGSVGMLLAIYVLRHKSQKTSFQLVIWLITLIQLVLIYQFTELIPNHLL